MKFQDLVVGCENGRGRGGGKWRGEGHCYKNKKQERSVYGPMKQLGIWTFYEDILELLLLKLKTRLLGSFKFPTVLGAGNWTGRAHGEGENAEEKGGKCLK